MFMVLSSWQSHCESSPGSFDECRMAPSGRQPETKPDDLGCESACTGCQKLHPPSPLVTLVEGALNDLCCIVSYRIVLIFCNYSANYLFAATNNVSLYDVA